MVHVCVLGENRQYSEDTLLKDVAKEVQESFSHEILLATVCITGDLFIASACIGSQDLV